MKPFGRNGRWFGLVPLVMGASLSIFEPAATADSAAGDTTRAAVQGRKEKSKSRAAGKRKSAKRHRRRHAEPVAAAQPAPPAPKLVASSPGPLQTPEALRSMELVRRGQIERAESAARRAELSNRWETVLFLLSGVENDSYPEAGFWKALASYRRGDLDGGDAIRQSCRLPPTDLRALDGERSVAALLADHDGGSSAGMQQAAFTNARSSQAVAGVHNNAPYTGPGPSPHVAAGPH